MSETVFDMACALCGELTAESETLLEKLCALWEERLAARLKSDISREDSSAFDISTALLAAAALKESGHGGGLSSFKVGDVSVTGTAVKEDAENMRRLAELMLAPFLCDGGFAFMGVDA